MRVIEDAGIAAVTVHRVGATVTRRVRVVAGAEGWPSEVAVVGLPLALADASVRVGVEAVEGEGAVVAGDPHVGLWARPAGVVGEAPGEAAVRAARRAVARTEGAIGQIEAELLLLGSAGVEPRPEPVEGQAPPPSPMGARLAWVAFTEQLSGARHAELLALRARLVEEREALAVVLDRAAQASSAAVVEAAAVTKQVRVALEVEGKPAAVVVAVSYFVPGARWVPTWQVRLDGGGAVAAIEMRAQVAQRSGEDWRGVALTVSTADPLRFTALRKLKSIRIGKQQPVAAAPGFRAPPQGGEALWVDFDRDRAALGAVGPGARWVAPVPAGVAEVVPWSVGVGAWAVDGEVDEIAAAADEAADEGVMRERAFAAPPASASRGGASFGAMPAPAPPGAPAPAMLRSAPRAVAKKASSRGRAEEVAVGGAAAAAGPSAVAFGALRLAAWGSAERGQLVAVERGAQYRDELVAGGRRLGFDPVAVVGAAEAAAAGVAYLALPANTRPVEDSSGLHDYAWVAGAAVDVPGDGGWHSVPVEARAVPCSLRFVVVPRVSPHVFRLASLTNEGQAPLLGGPVEVYVDGSYVLSTAMATVPAGGRFELGLGVEQGIRCARNARFEELRSDARVVAMTELRHSIGVEVANRLGRAADVEVRERIPQPAEGAEVVVEEAAVAPAWEVYSQVERGRPIEGGRRWRVSVGAGATARLSATYVVKIYAANELVGGNRREA